MKWFRGGDAGLYLALAAWTAFVAIVAAVFTAVFTVGLPQPGKHDDVMHMLQAQADDWNRGDLDKFMDGYWRSPDLTFVSGGKVTKGWDATMERYRKRYQADGKEMGRLTFSDLDIDVVREDLAVARGRWDLAFAKSDEKPGGRFTLFLRRIADAGWRIVYDHTSADEK